MIIVTATVLAPARKEGMHWKRIVQALFLVAIPSLLIFLQPDLGTMLVFTFMTFVVLFAGGATWKQLMALFGGAAAAVAVTLFWNPRSRPSYNRGKQVKNYPDY